MVIRHEHASIIGAIIGAIGAIIAALILVFKVKTIDIIIADIETKKIITGEVFIDTSKDGKPSYPDNPAVLKLRRTNRFLRVESKDYKPLVIPVKNINNSHIVELEAISCEVCKTITFDADFIPLSLTGWDPWGGLIVTRIGNEDVLNGQVHSTGGITNANMGTEIRGKILHLVFSNIDASTFDSNRLVKLTVNINDRTLIPDNRNLLHGEYISINDVLPDQSIEYIIPDDFDGKLGLVFYQATLNDLKITAYYK
ncbi:MAG: hypothetical protein FWD40_01150 [Treponema sp.]|nr:hypothetical protein [Treponema sp.]